MISAQECREYQGYDQRKIRLSKFESRIQKLDELIRERMKLKYNFRSLPLNDTGFGRLTTIEKKFLKNKGFKIWEGHGGKCGTFDIIGW